MKNVELVGVLNVTPDSFSDGGLFVDPEKALAHVHLLVNEGASMIDIGGDSTRPGSQCVGPIEEWRRIEPVLESCRQVAPFAVDTHHSEVAHLALRAGATMINDVMAGFDPEMFSVIADSSNAKYVMMYSRSKHPHDFSRQSVSSLADGDILERIKSFFYEKIELALTAGVSESQLVLDPGMGGFISSDPEDSWRVIRNFRELLSFRLPLYLGASRKGFLKLPLEADPKERDVLSAYIGRLVAASVAREPVNFEPKLYIRVHSIATQKAFLDSSFPYMSQPS
ncbi:MAG: dihydropteroate synthase [Bdellovibrionales bacterium]|nr:dihydropteroate synthase [Bdellovibrionales bacterium]